MRYFMDDTVFKLWQFSSVPGSWFPHIPQLFYFPELSSKAASDCWRTLREKREKKPCNIFR